MNNGNPLWDYIDHLSHMAKNKPEPEYHECESCGDKFDPETEPGGMKLTGEEEYYCPTCVKFSKHYAYIRDYAPTTSEAVFIINQLKYL